MPYKTLFNNTAHLFIFRFYIIFLCPFYFIGYIHSEALPSWNEGAAKTAIIQFIKETTEQGNKNFIPIEERIVTFDEDGTLWVEQPMYVEIFFAIEYIQAHAEKHPEWKEQEPFKSILLDAQRALATLSQEDVEKIIAVSHSGMSISDFHEEVRNWLKKVIHPRFKRPFTELVYQPMLEVIALFRDHAYKVYICSGGGQEFIRAFAEKTYGIPPERVIGTAGKIKYEYQEGHPLLMKIPELLFINDKQGKPEGINLIIGKHPVAAFGNSIGDRQMLEWTQGTKTKTLECLIHHDDAEREYAYGPDSKTGTFSTDLMDEAKKQQWIVVSMKNDWKVIFPFQIKK